MKRDDLYDLAALAVVAEQRSFTRAAAELGIPQSALSHAMKALEERIGPDIRMAVVGAPSYFADHPVPRTPRELSGQRCINYRQVRSGGLYAWDFEEKGRPFAVRVEGPLVFNNSDLIREAALAGQGLAYVYENEVVADLKAGRLRRILEKWCPAFPGYYLYHPSRRQTPPALAAFIGALRYKP